MEIMYICITILLNITTMAKGKNKGKRLTKNKLSEMLQTLFQQNPNETYTIKQIFKTLHLDNHPSKMLAMDILEDMSWDDFLSKPSEHSYRLNLRGQVAEGIFIRKANGKNSFLADGSDKPVFIAERNSMFALNGDRVKVTMMARREKHIKEAMVTEIIRRAHDQVVGRLQVERDFAFLIPDGNLFVHDIFIPKKKLKGGKTDDKAVVKITQWPSKESKNIVGEVIDVLGKIGENNAEMHAILAQYGLPYKYPKNVEEAANRIDPGITEQEIARREDFRDVTTFTIDPKDAKDFDDALSIREYEGNLALPHSRTSAPPKLWEVGVHIADVSHYVKEGSVIDKEAQKRATSVYLVDRTIPMLPERLCNFICSLRPDEEKLCYSVIFVLDGEANIKDWHLAHTVIKSNRRFAYEEVQEILEKNGVKDGTGEPAPARKSYEGEYAKELITSPPKKYKMSNANNTVNVVITVRESVSLIDKLIKSPKLILGLRRTFSRMRSKITIVSLIEKPATVRNAATTTRSISRCVIENATAIRNKSWKRAITPDTPHKMLLKRNAT